MTLSPHAAFNAFRESGVTFFTGVPDSALKAFNQVVAAAVPAENHVVAANEGAAVALAAGHYLATGDLSLVYLQNSGLGNAVNPLASLVHPSVYGLPLVLLVGWRGQPSTVDEPQHQLMGAITVPLLRLLGIETTVLDRHEPKAIQAIQRTCSEALDRREVRAIVIPRGLFAELDPPGQADEVHGVRRIDAVACVVEELPDNTMFVASTGFVGRELAEVRSAKGTGGDRDFLMVGSMGHAVSIALGLILARPETTVCCLDGDGAIVMHLGSLALIGGHEPPNLLHVVFNNGVHESVGGQPTPIRHVDLAELAATLGYASVVSCDSLTDLRSAVRGLRPDTGPTLIEVITRIGTLRDLGRPDNLVGRGEAFRRATSR